MLSLFALLGVFGFSAGLGATAFDFQESNHNNNLVVENQKAQPKLVSYDDESYTITLTADELNNYVFENLGTYLNSHYTDSDFLADTTIVYDSYTLEYSGLGNFVYKYGEYPSVYFYSSEDYVYNNKFRLHPSSGVFVPFEYGFTWFLGSSYYDDIKLAIELDIQANQPSGNPILTEIVSTLVGGITGIASGLGSGVSALVGDIFISNGDLTTFGYIVVIFAGIALAIGLSRWVMNFLTSLGAKK